MTHDYTNRYWGHDYVWEPEEGGLTGSLIGWGSGMKKGDYIILESGEYGSRYQFTSIKYFSDPPDMFSGKVKFVPRTEAQVKRWWESRPKSLTTLA